jgi:teichuronic acid biosynthesis glycosyltransferase TuaG
MVSIIVPVHNAEKYIRETVEAVKAQTYTDWELILVENGSVDRTKDVLREIASEAEGSGYNIRVIFSETTCAADARNEGLDAAKGRYIAYVDADDIWKPEKLERQMEDLRKRQETAKSAIPGFFFTGYEFGDEDAKGTGKIVRVPETLSYKEALANTTIFTSTVLVDTEVIPKELLHMPRIKSEDTATWWTILKAGYVAAGLNENLVKYRRPSNSLSSDKKEALRRIWNLYRKVAGLNVVSSAFHFCLWAVTAVWRRL